jgi:hypothetical protein
MHRVPHYYLFLIEEFLSAVRLADIASGVLFPDACPKNSLALALALTGEVRIGPESWTGI